MSMKKLNNFGDTIVEVLIAMAILGVVLSAAFVSVNRSVKNNTQSQEHSVALKLAEGQLETIREISSDTTNPNYNAVFTEPHMFCLDQASANIITASITDSTGPILANAGSSLDSNTAYGACGGINSLYSIAVGRDLVPGTTKQFIFNVYIRWDSVIGTTQDSVNLVYKVDQP